jgi:hypothetical protein
MDVPTRAGTGGPFKPFFGLSGAVRKNKLDNSSVPQKIQRVLDLNPAPFAAIVKLFTTIEQSYLNAIMPNNPSTLLFGPAVKNN